MSNCFHSRRTENYWYSTGITTRVYKCGHEPEQLNKLRRTLTVVLKICQGSRQRHFRNERDYEAVSFAPTGRTFWSLFQDCNSETLIPRTEKRMKGSPLWWTEFSEIGFETFPL